MSRPLLVRAAKWIVSLAATVLIAFFTLGLAPRSQPLADSVEVVEAGDPRVDGVSLRPYRAHYSTGTRALGLPVKSGAIDVELSDTEAGLSISFQFGPEFGDEMLLDRHTLAPIHRGFPGQQFEFDGARVTAALGGEGEAPDVRTFDFPVPVFEVSVLELVVAAAELDLPARVAWDNFADPTRSLARVREVGTELISAVGERFDTRIIDVGFADGKIRRYWLADRPPYKIKQRTFERGRSIVSFWELESFETP